MTQPLVRATPDSKIIRILSSSISSAPISNLSKRLPREWREDHPEPRREGLLESAFTRDLCRNSVSVLCGRFVGINSSTPLRSTNPLARIKRHSETVLLLSRQDPTPLFILVVHLFLLLHLSTLSMMDQAIPLFGRFLEPRKLTRQSYRTDQTTLMYSVSRNASSH